MVGKVKITRNVNENITDVNAKINASYSYKYKQVIYDYYYLQILY